MGDRYQPRPRGHGRPQDPRRDPQYEPYKSRRDQHGQHDRYVPSERYDGYDRYSGAGQYGRERAPSPRPQRYPPQQAQDRFGDRPAGGYNFRGAAAQWDQYRPPREEEQFSFQTTGPQAPRFPEQPRHALPPRPAKPLADRINGAQNGARAKPKHTAAKQRGNRMHAGNRGRPWRPFAPHQREILNRTERDSTPEQLEGMNGNGEARFKDLESSDEAVIDLTQDTEEETDGVPRKRMKTTDQPSTEQSTVPKWSNPECYTALPPPENAGGPKKDIVQVIRKSKVDAASKANFSNAVSNNADFISFFDDDNDNDSDDADAEDDSMNDSSSASDSDDFPTKKAAASLASRQQRSEPKPPSQATNSQNRFAALPTAHNFQANDALEVPPPPPPPPRSQFERSDSPPPPPPPQGLIIPDDAELATMYGDGPKGTKRKRQEQSRGVGQLVSEWLGNGIDESPWFSGSHIAVEEAALMLEIGNHSFDKYSLTPFTSSLHKEIRDFYEFVRPWDHEEAVRNDLIARVEKTVRKAYKVNGAQTAQILSFGSFASGLYLPTADMDLVAVSPNYLSHGVKTVCQTKNKLFALSRYLTYSGIAAPDTVSPVVGAKVPIVKFTDSLTGIKVDISFENDSGLKATDTFEQWKTQYPAMPALVMVIKQFLAMRDLNEVFTGGLGGFSIICLVVNMLAMMPEVQSSSIDPRQHCGEMLLKFFDLYGNHFDVVKTGLTMNPPGYFEKARHNRKFSKDNQRLTILDPNNPENDISGGTANINIILNCFREARHAILRRLYEIREGKGDNESILGCIIGGNYSGVALQRDRLRKLHAGEAVGPLLNAPTKSSQQPAAPKPVKKQKPVHDSRPQFAPKMRTRSKRQQNAGK